MLRTLALLFLIGIGLEAQTLPSVMLAAGAASNRQAWGTIAIRAGDSKMFSFSTLDVAPHVATPRTGGALLVLQKGGTSVLALTDVGAVINTPVTLGTFSGGAVIDQQFGKSGWHAILIVRVTATNATSIKPNIRLGIGRAF